MTTTSSPTEPIHPHIHTGADCRWQPGHVAWFNAEKGFGFITPDTGDAVFVDYRVIATPGYKTLTSGQPVVFTATDTARGPEATQVLTYPGARTKPRGPHIDATRLDITHRAVRSTPCRDRAA